MENQKREFTGVWIPKNIIEDRQLKPVDRLIYAEISCFEICTMTNLTLSERAGCSEDTASRSVGRLKTSGYIKVVGFNGRVRKMQSLHIAPPQNAEAASAKPHRLPPQNKAQDNSIDNKENTSITNVIEGKPQEYGNNDINEIFGYWSETIGIPIRSKVQRNRNSCSTLIKQHGLDGVKKLIQGVRLAMDDQYAPNISDFISLQSKQNELIMWGHKKEKRNAIPIF